MKLDVGIQWNVLLDCELLKFCYQISEKETGKSQLVR